MDGCPDFSRGRSPSWRAKNRVEGPSSALNIRDAALSACVERLSAHPRAHGSFRWAGDFSHSAVEVEGDVYRPRLEGAEERLPLGVQVRDGDGVAVY